MTKKPFSVKLADLRDMFKNTFNSACTSTVLVSPDPLSPTPTQENTKEDPDEPELADERDIQTEYTPPVNCMYRPTVGAVTKKKKIPVRA